MAEEIGMLKKFRRRFILITVTLVGVVAFIAFAAVDVTNYQGMRGEIGKALNKGTGTQITLNISLADGTGSDGGGESNNDDDNASSDGTEAGNGHMVHTIPMCSVLVTGSGKIIYDGDNDTIPLDSATLKGAVAEAASASQSDSQEGTPGELRELPDYGLYYKVGVTESGNYIIAFVPKSVLWEDLGQRTLVLLGAWLLLMFAVLVITFFLSRYVARPVEKAWKDQQRFIADASHELKTPLTVIMADVSILKDAPEKTVREQSNWVEGISNEAERMKQLTEDLLTLAQADAGVDMRQIMGDVDFSSVVEGQVLQFDAVAFERGLVIEDDVQESLHVTGDQMRLENMVKTLLENACKYAKQPGSIEVRLRQEKNEATLAIHNDGDPIPAEDLPHLFDRFYRSDKARAHEGEAASFGLGLSIAKSTAEMHKGTIGVSSDEGGTTFTVRIPLAKA